jgi:hypothetical protein
MMAEYASISYIPLSEPHDPCLIPILAHSTYPIDAAQLALLNNDLKHIFTNRVNVDQALKCLLLDAYDNMYTSELEDYLLQYTHRSAPEILGHLRTTYDSITPIHLADNCTKMTMSISFQDPNETLFKQIEDGVRCANAGMQP